MNSNWVLDEKRRNKAATNLYEALMFNYWNVPKEIQDHYGFTADYQLYLQIENMDAEERNKKVQTGELSDGLEVWARLVRSVEKAYESICGRPHEEYLDKLNGELETLGRIAVNPDSVHDLIHVGPVLLAKYGIDKTATPMECSRQAEKAYRELDARFVRMTGRKPYADELSSSLGRRTEEARPRRNFFRRPPSKGRKISL